MAPVVGFCDLCGRGNLLGERCGTIPTRGKNRGRCRESCVYRMPGAALRRREQDAREALRKRREELRVKINDIEQRSEDAWKTTQAKTREEVAEALATLENEIEAIRDKIEAR